jgi:hypothetical protein
MLYRRLARGVLGVNAGLLILGARRGDLRLSDGTALDALAALTLVNLAVAVLVRQQVVLNVLYGWAGRARPTWPLPVRRTVSKVHHVGGIHLGSAVAGTGWMVLFAVSALATRSRYPERVTLATAVLCTCLVGVLLVVTLCAAPVVRMKAHNVFEHSHRWGGWSAIALYWILTIHLAAHRRGGSTVLHALASDWHVWIVVLLTTSVAWPWVRLRRVPIVVERPSRHVTSRSSRSTTAFDRCARRLSASACVPWVSGIRSRP